MFQDLRMSVLMANQTIQDDYLSGIPGVCVCKISEMLAKEVASRWLLKWLIYVQKTDFCGLLPLITRMAARLA
jgi:hypothetical protein